MLHYLFGMCKDWQIAEDLSQELWASVHKSFKVSQYHDKPLLYCKAKQVFIDYYRKTIRRPDLHFSEIAYEGIIMPEAREADSPEEEERFFHAFWELFYPDEYDELSKRIFWFKHRYDYSMDEISERLQIPDQLPMTNYNESKSDAVSVCLPIHINRPSSCLKN